MSLFPSDRLGIALCPGQVGVVRYSRWPRAAIKERQVIAVDGRGWQAAIEALDVWFETTGIAARKADVVISNRYARYAWLPWNGDLTAAERKLLIDARFRELYGDMDGWVVSMDSGEYGLPTIASAVESAAIEELRRCFERKRIVCASLKPYFVAGWNRWRQDTGTGPAMFVATESGVTVLGILDGTGRQRHWRSMRAVLGNADSETLSTLVARESILQGLAEPPSCYVLAPAQHEGLLQVPLATLPDEDTSAAPLTMALCGLGQ